MSTIVLPSSPSVDQEIILAGKLFIWTGSRWSRSAKYAIIDAGISDTEITSEFLTADGGNA